MSPPATSGGSWTETVLYSFQSVSFSDGANPQGNLAFDVAGNLYGVTASGGSQSSLSCGSSGCGTAFQLKPHSTAGGAWTEIVLYNFGSNSSDSFDPGSGLLIGPGGVLYGTAGFGGTAGVGTFFKLTPPAISGGSWNEKILYNFQGGTDGALPNALTFGRHGVIFGTTGMGGTSNKGTVFELSPPVGGAGWTESVIYNFTNGTDGAGPTAGVILEGGNLYGTASKGGNLACMSGVGCGTVFKLSPPSTSGGTWTETTLYDFAGGRDGAQPESSLLFRQGSLFGTTTLGGTSTGSGNGVVFRVVP